MYLPLLLSKKNYSLIFLIFLLSFSACNRKKPSNDVSDTPTTTPLVLQDSPSFNADSAFEYIRQQVAFGPRVPNTSAHQKCGDFLLNELKTLGWDTLSQAFEAKAYDGTLLKSRNIIASYKPEINTRILLSAHWDTRPYNDKESQDSTQYVAIDGANDGASGVGVLLEIARVLSSSEQELEIGVDIIFFDSEDYGAPVNYPEYQADKWCLGSQYWSNNKHQPNYAAYYGLLLDMVGAKDARFYREAHSQQFAPSIVRKLWQIAHQLGYQTYFVQKDSPALTDDHYYVNTLAKIPMIDVIDYDAEAQDFQEYHHTQKDNLDLISKETLKAVGQSVLQLLYNEAAELQ